MGTALSGGRWVSGGARGDVNAWVTPAELAEGGCSLLAAIVEDLTQQLRSQFAAQGCVWCYGVYRKGAYGFADGC
jgi:hypothetical protein